MDTVTSAEIKKVEIQTPAKNEQSIAIEVTQKVARRTADILNLVGGALPWFGKEWLEPDEIKKKYMTSHNDIVTDEEMQIILEALACFLTIKCKPCPGGHIYAVKYRD